MPVNAAAATAAVPKPYSFNSSPLQLPSFLEFLRNHIPASGANFRTLLRQMTITTSGNRPKTVCVSTAHLVAIRDGLLAEYSFDALPPQPFCALEVACRETISKANAAACLRNSGVPGQFEYPYPSKDDATVMAATDADFAALPISAEDSVRPDEQIETFFIDICLVFPE